MVRGRGQWFKEEANDQRKKLWSKEEANGPKIGQWFKEVYEQQEPTGPQHVGEDAVTTFQRQRINTNKASERAVLPPTGLGAVVGDGRGWLEGQTPVVVDHRLLIVSRPERLQQQHC